MVSRKGKIVVHREKKLGVAKMYTNKNEKRIVAKVVKRVDDNRTKQKGALKVMRKGEFEKIITEHNKKARELPQKIIELPKTKNGNIVDDIKPEEITFVVSGSWDHQMFNLRDSLSSIRRAFPKSTIILSTWENFDKKEQKKYNGLYDELVLNSRDELPWKNICYTYIGSYEQKENSYNHQHLLTFRAFEKVKTKYAVRMRTDCFVNSDRFLRLYIEMLNSVPFVDESFRLFKQRILTDSTYIMQPLKTTNSVFGISDIFQFGLTEDLKKLWDDNYMPADVAKWDGCDYNLRCKKYFCLQGRYGSEQFFCINAVIKHGIPCVLPYSMEDLRVDVRNSFKRFLASNIMCCPFEMLDINNKFIGRLDRCGLLSCHLDDLREFIKTEIKTDLDAYSSDFVLFCEKEYIYETARRDFIQKRNALLQSSQLVYPLFKYLKRMFKTLQYMIVIVSEYPILLVKNWKRHRLKYRLKRGV